MKLEVLVKPGSKLDLFSLNSEGVLCIKIKAPAEDGKANKYLIKLLAKKLKVPTKKYHNS